MITLSTLDVLLGGPRQNIAMRFGMEKRTMSQWLLGGEFFFENMFTRFDTIHDTRRAEQEVT